MRFINPDEKINCDNVLQCVFELNDLDIKVYKMLRESRESRADELAKKLKKDRSNIYRSLEKIACCGLCSKEKRTIEKGGYYHTYRCKDTRKIKEDIEEKIDSWHKKMKDTLKELK